jgi:SAM-dependent methyltransferase
MPRRALQVQLIKKGVQQKSNKEKYDFNIIRKQFEIDSLENIINKKNNFKGEFSYIFEKKDNKLLYKATSDTFEEIYKNKKDPWNQSDLNDKYYAYARNKIYELLNKKNDTCLKILELGCGNGFSTNFLKNKLNKKEWEFYGCDISPTAIKHATEKYSDINFFVHDIKNKLPVDNKFDIIIFGDMLWYILNDLETCINNSLDVVKDEIIFYNAFLKDQKYGKDIINGYTGFHNFCKEKFNVSYAYESNEINYKTFGVVCIKNI